LTIAPILKAEAAALAVAAIKFGAAMVTYAGCEDAEVIQPRPPGGEVG
jgi:hypothetical protein